MKNTLILAVLFILPQSFVYGFGSQVIISKTRIPSHVCFGGREMQNTADGIIWLAKRGCFVSQAACVDYGASVYGTYYSVQPLKQAYIRCRQNYPFRLGMQ